MRNLLGNSAMPQYIKLLAALMLASTYLGALIIYGIDLLGNLTPPAVVTFVVGTGLASALSVLNLHSGAQLAETMPNALPEGSVPGVVVNAAPIAPAPAPETGVI